MTDYPYKTKIKESILLHSRFRVPAQGASEYRLQNRCKADFCFDMSPSGKLFIEDDDGARGVNNLIKYWIWCEDNPNERPVHLIHILEMSRPAQVENIKFLAEKVERNVPQFTFHLIALDSWQQPDESWMPRFREIVARIDEADVHHVRKT